MWEKPCGVAEEGMSGGSAAEVSQATMLEIVQESADP